MNEKLVGYVLLIAGLVLIIFAAFSVYSVFTKKSMPIAVFDFPSISISADTLFSGASLEEKDAQKNMNQGQTPEVELLPAKVLNDSSNLFAHLFLMGFLASIGSRISSIGVSLLRPIVVKMKSEEDKPSKNDTL